MSKQDTLRNLLIAGAIFVMVMAVAPVLFPTPVRHTPPTDTATPSTTTEDPSRVGERPASATDTPGVEPGAQPDRAGWSVAEAAEARSIAIGASLGDGVKKRDPGPYRMRLTISNIGAAIESAHLTDHAETLGSMERYQLLSTIERLDGRRFRSLAVERINIDDVVLPLDNVHWHLEPVQTFARQIGTESFRGESITARLDLLYNGEPALRLTRQFELPQQPLASGRHDLFVTLRIENLTDQARKVVVQSRGAVGFRSMSPHEDRVVDIGVWEEGRVLGTRKTAAQIAKLGGMPDVLFSRKDVTDARRPSWVANGNIYFTCTMAPQDAAGVAEVVAVDLDGDPATLEDATVRLTSVPMMVEPGQAQTVPKHVYIGQKDGDAFRAVPDYRDRNYYFQISEGFGWCTFTWLVELMIWLLNKLYAFIPDYGVAIIILVFIVRTILHPITKRGQVNMVRMQQQMSDFAPKMEEMKRRYANDKTRLHQETMKLYREHGINPAGNLLTCLPMLLQMPIWIALYLSLNNNIGMRHEPFLFTWVRDLTAPDALIVFSSHWPLIGGSFNLLPLLVSAFMYLQQKMQPKPKPNPNMTDQQKAQQEMMQKMIPLMSIMMLIFFYHAPSGLNLYIMFSSMLGTVEQHLIRKHIRAREEAGTLGPSAASGGKDPSSGGAASGKPSFFERLQKMAEDAQKAQPKKPGRGPRPRR